MRERKTDRQKKRVYVYMCVCQTGGKERDRERGREKREREREEENKPQVWRGRCNLRDGEKDLTGLSGRDGVESMNFFLL